MRLEADLEEFINDRYRRSVEAFILGDPEPQKKLWSRADDATLANPMGPPARGWSGISEMLDRASSLLRDGKMLSVDRVSSYSTPDVAWTLEIEHSQVKVAGAEERSPVSLRATTIFRREDSDWRIAHRHADPITTARPPESMLQD
jgi:ketosteroid isomerase-like protein